MTDINNIRSSDQIPTTALPSSNIQRDKQILLNQSNERYLYRSKKLNQTHGLYVKVLFLLGVLQTIGIAFFSRGFLLSRNVLENHSTCSEQQSQYTGSNECFKPSPYKKAVILVVDALRFDFTIPVEGVTENSNDYNYHNHFSIFYDTFLNYPENSVLLKFIADPPTTTLQRLKGLTTGSLPTFIDAGSNFDGDTVTEDNLISQLYFQGKKVAFAGDDTWTAMFSPYLYPNLTFPYDSLNVWDLHSVDNGVIEHIFPLLEKNRQKEWDVLIGHFLGVDHCGHRYGPSHYAMKDKLQQIQEVIRRVMDEIDDETLLIVFGDHGMDSTGNHGGESDDEVEAALFMYSKSKLKSFGRFSNNHYNISNIGKNYRQVNQIDLVPTLSLLLGIPIPFNNLGSPIAEAFMHNAENFAKSSVITSSQINNYRHVSDELVGDYEVNTAYENSVQSVNSRAYETIIEKNFKYQKLSLSKCKELWATFDNLNIGIGIFLIFISLILLIIYSKLVPSVVIAQLNGQFLLSSLVLILVYCVLCASFSFIFKPESLPLTWALLLGLALGIANGILAPIMDRYSIPWLRLQICENLIQNGWTYFGILLTILHSLIFTSNSYIIWEDKIVAFWLLTFGFLAFFKSFQLPERHKQLLGAYHSFVFMVLTRLSSTITLCREEQGDKCVSNFKITWWSIVLLYASAFVLPSMIKYFYKISHSYEGAASMWIAKGLRSTMFLIALLWTLEFIENDESMNKTFNIPFTSIKTIRLTLARIIMGVSLIAANIGWNSGPLCIRVELQEVKEKIITENTNNKKRVKNQLQQIEEIKVKKTASIIGFGNAYGSMYFLFFINILCSILAVSKPLGGISLFLLVNQLLSLFELVDLLNIRTNFISVIVVGLLGYLHFFTTGHQATLQSIQWETGFSLTETITFPLTHLAIVLNTLGPFILISIAVTLLSLWKISPTNKPVALISKIVENATSLLIYQTCLTLATLIMTNHFRRHLMVWKIFAPRFMLNSIILVLMNFILTFISVGYVSLKVLSRWYDVFGA